VAFRGCDTTGISAPGGLISLSGLYRCAFSRQITREKGRKVRVADALIHFSIHPLPFHTAFAVQYHQIALAQDLGQPTAALPQPLGLGRNLAVLDVVKVLCNRLPLLSSQTASKLRALRTQFR